MTTQITVSRKNSEIAVQFVPAEGTNGAPVFGLRDVLPGIARAWRVLADDIAVSSDGSKKPSWILFDYRKPRVEGGVRYVKVHTGVDAVRSTLNALVKHGKLDGAVAAKIGAKAEERGVSFHKPFMLAFDEKGQLLTKWRGWMGWKSYAVAIALLYEGKAFAFGKSKKAEEAWLKYADGIRENNYRLAIKEKVAWRKAGKGVTTKFGVADAETGVALTKYFPTPQAALEAAEMKGWKKAAITAIAKVNGDWQTIGSQIVEVAAS